ncbi:hypothetical protein [Pelomonas sp. Root1444]|uniref:hypothetical protein n=1 Tax=Pelomonas sp. Root1444 TaxID=1736464 RepID=UPI000B16A4BB|nr:hypothetical protein [Pelomonas sp. Root1444]
MFVSRPHYERALPAGLEHPAARQWRIVELALNAPWFLLSLEVVDDEEPALGVLQTLCIASDQDLLSLLSGVDPARVRGVVCMLPAWLSSTGQWCSRDVREVWQCASDTGRWILLVDKAGQHFDLGMRSENTVPATRELVLRLRSGATPSSACLAAGISSSRGYASSISTKALFNASSEARDERAGATDMLSIPEAARLVAVRVATLRSWIRDGRVIALELPHKASRLPRWQFEPAMWDAIPDIAKALGTTHGWDILGFLETPCGMLDGVTPREAMERGRLQRVLDAAWAASF